jgi:hypothetical protein
LCSPRKLPKGYRTTKNGLMIFDADSLKMPNFAEIEALEIKRKTSLIIDDEVDHKYPPISSFF